ncbi:MAG: hypothetical protein DU429_06280 [Candidatus Tokpelaia sp.]|nr:MAG: hypothetical protein DU430_01660 [Candidatus Tokpelaia sp.]KAA6206327.1 MAG: hypothetical protein DU429_06280 [Candidatus Tokpelaia sp.]
MIAVFSPAVNDTRPLSRNPMGGFHSGAAAVNPYFGLLMQASEERQAAPPLRKTARYMKKLNICEKREYRLSL